MVWRSFTHIMRIGRTRNDVTRLRRSFLRRSTNNSFSTKLSTFFLKRKRDGNFTEPREIVTRKSTKQIRKPLSRQRWISTWCGWQPRKIVLSWLGAAYNIATTLPPSIPFRKDLLSSGLDLPAGRAAFFNHEAPQIQPTDHRVVVWPSFTNRDLIDIIRVLYQRIRSLTTIPNNETWRDSTSPFSLPNISTRNIFNIDCHEIYLLNEIIPRFSQKIRKRSYLPGSRELASFSQGPRVKHRYVSRPDIPVDRATFLNHEAQQVQRSGRCVSSGAGAWKSGRRTKLSSRRGL